jgi:tripartite-type tricarboxylate transporter receptor subunit TctC
MTTWYGVFAPAGTPPAIVNRLHADIARAMEAPDTKERLVAIGVDDTVTRTPEEFAVIVRNDTARYAKVVKDAGLKMD